jgi:hypothetical protein
MLGLDVRGFKAILAGEALAISLRATGYVGSQVGEIGIWKGSATVQAKIRKLLAGHLKSRVRVGDLSNRSRAWRYVKTKSYSWWERRRRLDRDSR